MITLTGIVFSLVFVMVQFGTTAYSPRLTRVFERSYVLRHSLGIFTGTFLYSLMAMRSISIKKHETSRLAVWIAFVWLITSVAILIKLIQVFTSITESNILGTLTKTGYRSINRVYRDYMPKKNEF